MKTLVLQAVPKCPHLLRPDNTLVVEIIHRQLADIPSRSEAPLSPPPPLTPWGTRVERNNRLRLLPFLTLLPDDRFCRGNRGVAYYAHRLQESGELGGDLCGRPSRYFAWLSVGRHQRVSCGQSLLGHLP